MIKKRGNVKIVPPSGHFNLENKLDVLELFAICFVVSNQCTLDASLIDGGSPTARQRAPVDCSQPEVREQMRTSMVGPLQFFKPPLLNGEDPARDPA